MKISVIIPTYNRANILKRCLDALSHQQGIARKDYEIIVIDDGSTDDTAGVAKIYDVNYYRQQNKGPAAARNLGVKRSGAGIIAFLDDDCVPERLWLKKILSNFGKYQDASVLGSNSTFVYPRMFNGLSDYHKMLLKNNKIRKKKNDVIIMHGLNPKNVICTDNCAVKKTVFNKLHGFKTKYKYAGEDPDFWYRMMAKGYKIYFTDDFHVKHHQRETIAQIISRHFRFGKADVINYKDNFRNHIWIDTSIFELTYYTKSIITLRFRNNFVKMLILAAAVFAFSPIAGLVILAIILLKKLINMKSFHSAIQSIIYDLLALFPELFGNIIESIRQGIVCI